MLSESQAKATKKYEEKAGIAAKTYKLNKRVAEEFKKTCAKVGISQAAQLNKLMQQFIDENKEA